MILNIATLISWSVILAYFPYFPPPMSFSLQMESARYILKDAVGLKGLLENSLSLPTTDIIIPCFHKLFASWILPPKEGIKESVPIKVLWGPGTEDGKGGNDLTQTQP